MDKELRSYLYYFGLLILIFILGDIAQKRNNKKLVFIIALLLSLIMGLRKKTVGVDTYNYYWMIGSIHEINDINSFSDPLFYFYTYILRRLLFNDTYNVFLVISFVTNFLIVFRLWDFKDISSFKYGILRYYTIFYFFAFNCMRQMLAIAIVFYVSRYIKTGKYFKFGFWVIFASTIHLSSFISFLFLALEIFRKDELSIRQRNYASLFFLALPITILMIFFVSQGRYESYFSTFRLASPSSLILKCVLFIIAIIYMHYEKRFTKRNYDEFLCFIYYSIGLLFNVFGLFFPLIERSGYYFYIYATTYLGILANDRRYRYIIRIVILFIIIRAFYINVTTNSMGQIPYLFNWE